MLQITGTINGKTYEDKVVSAPELVNMFKLGLNPTKSVQFELDKNMMTRDVINNIWKFSPLQNLQPVYNGNDNNGNAVTVRYFKTKTNDKNNPKFFPPRIPYKGRYVSVSSEQFEIAVWMALNPKCGTSPLHPKGGKKTYKLMNRAEVAQQNKKQQVINFNIAKLVLEEKNTTKLRHIASAIRIKPKKGGVRMISNVKGKSIEEIHMELFQMAKDYPQQFAAQWNDVKTTFHGMLKSAVDAGLFTQRSAGPGRMGWFWRADLHSGNMLTVIGTGKDPFTVLLNYASSPEVWPDIAGTIEENDPNNQLDENLAMIAPLLTGKVPVDEMAPIQLIEEAEKLELIAYDMSQKKWLLIEDGKPKGTFAVVEDFKNRRAELATKLEGSKIQRNQLKKLLRNANDQPQHI